MKTTVVASILICGLLYFAVQLATYFQVLLSRKYQTHTCCQEEVAAMSEFYVTLHSGTNKEGKTGDFYNRLSHTVPLNGSGWECALSSIIYPLSWYNLKDEIEQRSMQSTSSILVVFEDFAHIGINIGDGYFENVDELITAIKQKSITEGWSRLEQAKIEAAHANTTVPPEEEAVYRQLGEGGAFDFIYHPALKRVLLMIHSDRINRIHLSSRLAYMMGFERKYIRQRKEIALNPPDLNICGNMIFTYLNIIEPQFMGSTTAQLLKVVHVNNNRKYGEIIEKQFPLPQYVPVNVKELSRLEVSLRFDNGEIIGFRSGKVLVILHFRKRKLLIQ